MIRPLRPFSLVGPGRVGSSLAMALEGKGWECRHILPKDRSESQRRKLSSVFPAADIVERASSLADDFEILFIAVQDDEIENVVDGLLAVNNISWKSKVVLHTSGVKSVGLLQPLRGRGASVGALHPIAAFANRYQPRSASEIYYDFFGDKKAQSVARRIAGLLNSKLIILKNERQRMLLHIASAIASNSTVVAIRSAEELVSGFIHPRDAKALMTALLSSTVSNLSENEGMKSLTGPLARADIEVISDHIKALESKKTLLQFYKSWSLLGIDSLLRDGHDRKSRCYRQA